MACHINIYESNFKKEELDALNAPTTVTAAAGAWNVGNQATIFTAPARIKITNVYMNPSAAEWYNVEITDDAGPPENVLLETSCPGVACVAHVQSEIIESGTNIEARCESLSGGNTIDIKIGYIEVT